MSADDFANMVEGEAGEYGDGGPYAGWSFSREELIGFCGAIINGWRFDLRVRKDALAASQTVGEIVGYMDPDADFLLPSVSGRHVDVVNLCLWEKPIGKYTKPLYAAPPAQAVDLGQFREAVHAQFFLKVSEARKTSMADVRIAEADAERNRLLAVIDGAEVNRG